MGGLAFIYSGLDSISSEGREQLKSLAQSLVEIQNHPGVSVSDNIYRNISLESGGNALAHDCPTDNQKQVEGEP